MTLLAAWALCFFAGLVTGRSFARRRESVARRRAADQLYTTTR